MSLYTDLLEAEVPIDNHESDLYFLDTRESRALIEAYKIKCGAFVSRIDGKVWRIAHFHYDPWWERHSLAPQRPEPCP